MSEPNDRAPATRVAVLGEIALEVAHELRNLLLVIDGSTYIAKQSVTSACGCACAAQLDKIERSVRAARGVVDDVFLLATEERVQCEPVTLARVVSLARSELGELSSGGEPTWVDAFGDATILAHERLLARALKVIYENAIQLRLPERACIETRVVASSTARTLTIEIQDDGPGVPPDLGDRIFDPLVTSRPGGTGMGLPLARRIVAAHGGEIRLAPAAAAPHVRGACFRLILPI